MDGWMDGRTNERTHALLETLIPIYPIPLFNSPLAFIFFLGWPFCEGKRMDSLALVLLYHRFGWSVGWLGGRLD
jgi:hypothetical protein